jgi:uncharacterized protein (TIRG00374 family)
MRELRGRCDQFLGVSVLERKGKNAFHLGIVFAGSLTAGIALLAIFLYFVGFAEVIKTIRSVDPTLMFLAFILDMAGLFLYGACWYVLLRGAGLKIRFPTTISIALAGIFLCYITPSGAFMDASRVLLASKESDIRIGDSAATVILHKIIFTLGFVTYALLAMTMLFVTSGVSQPFFSSILAVTLLVIIGIAGMTLFVVKADQLRRYAPGPVERLKRILHRVTGKYQRNVSSIGGFAGDFRRTFVKLLKTPSTLLVSYGLSLSYWTTSVLILYIVFLALGYKVSVWAIMLTITVGDFIQMMPIAIPGMLGVLEVVATTVLMMFGVPLGVAASATLLARIATFWFDLPVTGAAASYYGAKYMTELTSYMTLPSG